MYNKGLTFKVTKNGIIGKIISVSHGIPVLGIESNVYEVAFYENGKYYYNADVFEDTITNNLKCGCYEIVA